MTAESSSDDDIIFVEEVVRPSTSKLKTSTIKKIPDRTTHSKAPEDRSSPSKKPNDKSPNSKGSDDRSSISKESNDKGPPLKASANSTSSIPMPLLQQRGKVFVGKNAQHEAWSLGMSLPVLDREQKDGLYQAQDFAVEQSIMFSVLKNQIIKQTTQRQFSLYLQGLYLMCQIYIGGINCDIREKEVRDVFEGFGQIRELSLAYEPLTTVHKGFGFITYDVPEAAHLAIETMEGYFLAGRVLKVNRPNCYQQIGGNYMGQNFNFPPEIIENIQKEAEPYNRIYVGSVQADLSEKDLEGVFGCFGEIKTCEMIRDVGTTQHRGMGYIEFATEQACKEAIGMNRFELCGQTLRVCKAISPPRALEYLFPSGTDNAIDIVKEAQKLSKVPTKTQQV